MLRPGDWQSTTEYRATLKTVLKRLSRNPAYGVQTHQGLISKIENLCLDKARRLLAPLYPDTGRPAKNQTQILRSQILFTFLLDKTPARNSITSWIWDVLPASPLFFTLIGFSSADSLPPPGSYYDFMDRCWQGSREQYARDFPLPAGKNGKKPKKQIGDNGTIIEDASFAAKPLAKALMNGKRATDNPESIMQDIFFLTAVLPSKDGQDMRHYNDPDVSWGYDMTAGRRHGSTGTTSTSLPAATTRKWYPGTMTQ